MRLFVAFFVALTIIVCGHHSCFSKRMMVGHQTGARYSPDGKTLLTSGRNNTVGLWNASTGEELKVLRGHIGDVLCVAFSCDGKLAASGSDDRTIRVWDVASGQLRGCFEGHLNSVNSVEFSRDGKKILSCSADGSLKLWDTATGAVQHTFIGHAAAVNCAIFSNDNKYLISASDDNTIRIWDVSEKRAPRILLGKSAAVFSVAISPDGKSLASGGADRFVKFWNFQTGEERCSRLVSGRDVQCVTYSPDGKIVAICGSLIVLRLLDSQTAKDADLPQKAMTVSSMVLTPHTYLPNAFAETRVERSSPEILFSGFSCSLSFSPDGANVAISGCGPIARICEVASGQTLVTIAGFNFLHDLIFSPDGKIVASANDHTITCWDAANGRELRSFSSGKSLSGCDSPVFSPDGSKIFATTLDIIDNKSESTILNPATSKTVKVWDVKTSACLGIAPVPSNHLGKVAINSDGTMFATSSDEANVVLFDAKSLQELHRFVGGQINYARALAFSPDDSLIASGGWDHTLQIWNVKSGQLMHSLTTYGYTYDLKFSPDGRFVACGGLDSSKKGLRRDQQGVIDPSSLKPPIEIWSVSDGSKVRDLRGPGDCDSIVFSPDGKLLAATVGGGTKILIWDFKSGSIVKTLTSAHRQTRRIAISPDGKMLACENGQFIERWDIASGRLLKTFTE